MTNRFQEQNEAMHGVPSQWWWTDRQRRSSPNGSESDRSGIRVWILSIIVLCLLYGSPILGAVIRVSEEEPVLDLQEVGGRVWVAMESGLHQFQNGRLVQVRYENVFSEPTSGEATWPQGEISARVLAEIDRELWVGTSNRLWRVKNGEWLDVFRGPSPEITKIQSHRDDVWIGTTRGLVSVKRPEFRLSGFVSDIKIIDNALWIVAGGNLYQLREDGSAFSPIEIQGYGLEMWPAGRSVWVTTLRNFTFGRFGAPNRLNRMGKREKAAGLDSFEVLSVAEIHGEPWFSTTKGVVRFHAGAPRIIVGSPSHAIPNTVREIRGDVLIGTTNGVYEAPDTSPAGPMTPEIKPLFASADLNVKAFRGFRNGRWWALAREGLFLFSPETRLNLRLNSYTVFGSEFILGNQLRLKEFSYQTPSSNEVGTKIVRQGARWLFVPINKAIDSEISRNDFLPIEQGQHFSCCLHRGSVVGIDAFGNSTMGEPVLLVVVPREALTILAIAALFGIGSAIARTYRAGPKRIEDTNPK